MFSIKISKTENSRLPKADFNNLAFGQVFSDHMFIADYTDGEWKNFEIRPLENLSVHPGNIAWHYGQSIFEGMKASIGTDGTPYLFRPEEHAKRLNNSAHRMCIPEVPEELFLKAVHRLVDVEKEWIPTMEGGALYLRPFIFATDEVLGVRTSSSYKFIIMALPVGPYYTKPVSLKAEDSYIRAAIGGTGEAKAAGNYAGSLYPAMLANQQGFDQILWLDAAEFKYIQEVGTMNIFFVINDTIITPKADGAILKGITRKSILHLLKDKGYNVEERRLSIDEVVQAYENGTLQEVFGSGTAAVISYVKSINYKGKDMVLDLSKQDISIKLKQFFNDLRAGKIEDEYNWRIPVNAAY